MISKLLYKYDNLKPEHKALADIAGLLFTALLCTGIVAFVASHGYWFEMAMVFLAYGCYGLFKTFYDARVFYYKCKEHDK